MRLYWEVAKRSFQRQLAYRAATLAGLVTNTFFGYLRGAVFIALFATRPEVAGWDVRDALTYVWLTQALIMIVQLWGWWEVADNIKTGDVASDLAKPFDYYLLAGPRSRPRRLPRAGAGTAHVPDRLPVL